VNSSLTLTPIAIGNRIMKSVRTFFMHPCGFRSEHRGDEESQASCQSGNSEAGNSGRYESCDSDRFETDPLDAAPYPQELVQVRIHRRFVAGPGESSMPLRPSDVDHIYILEGSLLKFLPFSGTTCGWLLDVLDLVFGPYCGGQLYTPPSSSPDWIGQVMSPDWKLVSICLVRPLRR
jgi:hypothetical protein